MKSFIGSFVLITSLIWFQGCESPTTMINTSPSAASAGSSIARDVSSGPTGIFIQTSYSNYVRGNLNVILNHSTVDHIYRVNLKVGNLDDAFLWGGSIPKAQETKTLDTTRYADGTSLTFQYLSSLDAQYWSYTPAVTVIVMNHPGQGITSPATNSSVSGLNAQINTSFSGGDIGRVDFYVGSALSGTASLYPYNALITAPDGTYGWQNVTAKAFDPNNGLVATSSINVYFFDPYKKVHLVGDFNGDGKADLFSADYYQDQNGLKTWNAFVLLSNGNGYNNAIQVLSSAPLNENPQVADVNGDGKSDILLNFLGATNMTYTYLSNGDGTFQTSGGWQHPEPGSWAGQTFQVADVNGDGKADLVFNYMTSSSNGTHVCLSNGDGTYQNKASWIHSEPGSWLGQTLQLADVNGDGKADLVFNYMTSSSNGTHVCLSIGDGTFQAKASWVHPEPGSWLGQALFLADVNGDGKADLVFNYATATSNGTHVCLSNGDGTFQQKASWIHPEGSSWVGQTLQMADINGDGKADLVFSYLTTGSNTTHVCVSNGDGTFQAKTLWNHPQSGWTNYKMYVGDVNGDGKKDLMWNRVGTLNATYTALSNGDGSFQAILPAYIRPSF